VSNKEKSFDRVLELIAVAGAARIMTRPVLTHHKGPRNCRGLQSLHASPSNVQYPDRGWSGAIMGVFCVANQNLVVKDGIASVPEEIKELWGSPPILRSEDLETYYRLAAYFAGTVKPHDIIEWFWLKDILDLTCDMRRLHRFKADIIECKPVNCETSGFRARGQCTYQRSEEAQVFFESSKDFERIERMLAMLEVRRNKIISDFEGRRVDLAWQLRKASDNIIEGEFDESPDVRANAA
jgi:hypothetical protein